MTKTAGNAIYDIIKAILGIANGIHNFLPTQKVHKFEEKLISQ